MSSHLESKLIVRRRASSVSGSFWSPKMWSQVVFSHFVALRSWWNTEGNYGSNESCCCFYNGKRGGDFLLNAVLQKESFPFTDANPVFTDWVISARANIPG